MANGLVLFQVASIVALVGMGLGWRGVMTRYSGFYDLPTAWTMMFWGILLGGFYGNMADEYILRPLISSDSGFPFTNLIICLVLSVIVHLILRRERVRRTGSQPTTGWALGLSVGGMIGMYVIYRVLEPGIISFSSIATVALIAIVSPRGHALIFCRHGHDMLMGQRWKATLKTFIYSTLLLIVIYAAIFDMRTWIFVIPILLLAERSAHDWVWAAVPRPARRRLRRIWSDASRTSSTGQQLELELDAAKAELDPESNPEEMNPLLEDTRNIDNKESVDSKSVNITYNIQNIAIQDSVLVDSNISTESE
jgi:hypothetical protein